MRQTIAWLPLLLTCAVPLSACHSTNSNAKTQEASSSSALVVSPQTAWDNLQQQLQNKDFTAQLEELRATTWDALKAEMKDKAGQLYTVNGIDLGALLTKSDQPSSLVASYATVGEALDAIGCGDFTNTTVAELADGFVLIEAGAQGRRSFSSTELQKIAKAYVASMASAGALVVKPAPGSPAQLALTGKEFRDGLVCALTLGTICPNYARTGAVDSSGRVEGSQYDQSGHRVLQQTRCGPNLLCN